MDFSLSAFASCLAVFSVGMGLRTPEIGWFFCGWIVLGAVVSSILCRVIPEKFAWTGGLLYSLVSIGSVTFVQTLNSWLPKGGFPVQLIIAASLAYMLLFGSFLTWRDSTIVFQAVPSIAIFGLVGAWDTFSGAPFAFFGFLLCFATLFARAHGRTMMSQAEDSGFSTAIRTRLEATDDGLFDTLKKGPWRWMAGPEWALGSAAVIVLLSVLGAPVLQSSVQGVAGFVSIQVPQAPVSNSAINTSFNANALGNVNVGQGPRRNLRKKPVFTARLTELEGSTGVTELPTYFRVRTYGAYTGKGWQPIGDFPNRTSMQRAIDDDRSFMNRSRLAIEPFSRVQFDLELLTRSAEGIPIPGEIEYLQNTPGFARRTDGLLREANAGSFQPAVGGIVRVPRVGSIPTTTLKADAVYSQDSGKRIPDRVRNLAVRLTAGAANDFEKATRIKEEIAKMVVYDLGSPPVPAGSDPAEWFLFEGKTGYCDLFATAMTTMARSVSLPARYVTGYYPALSVTDSRGRSVLHESEAHAWCEIYFEGHGWVAFDATEGAIDVGAPTEEEALMDQGWFRAAVFTLTGLLVVATPWGISYWLKLRRMSKDPIKRFIAIEYARFVRGLEKRSGKPKRPSQTPSEYIVTIIPLIGVGKTEVIALNERFEAILYSQRNTMKDGMGSLKEEVASVVRLLNQK